MHKMLNIATKLCADQLGLSPERIAGVSASPELEADSLNMAEVLVALEDIYEVDFPADDREFSSTSESLVAHFNKYIMQEVKK